MYVFFKEVLLGIQSTHRNELLAFVSYTSLNIGLTGFLQDRLWPSWGAFFQGVPVPSGNFTGSMLIGGPLGLKGLKRLPQERVLFPSSGSLAA